MLTLTNDPARIAGLCGFDVWRHSLPPKLGIDQFRDVLPILVTDGAERSVLIAKEIDRTNMQAVPSPGVRFVFHTPYFSFDRVEIPSDARPSLVAAVAEVADGATDLDPSLPVALYGRLADALGTREAAAGRFHTPSYHYRVARAEVGAAAEEGRAGAASAAAPYVDRIPDAGRVRAWLGRQTENPLDLLDTMLDEAGTEAVIASSPINVQELTGIPARQLPDGAWAIYTRGSAEVHVLSRREVPWLGLPETAIPDASAVLEFTDGARLGYEESDLSFRAFRAFGLDRATTVPATALLRRWREKRCWEDLAYYVMATQVTLLAIDEAIGVIEAGMASGDPAREVDAYERYRAVLAEHVANLPIRIRTYFTHAYAGDRSHIPASATDHRVGAGTSLKIDAGVEVYDPRGYLRAVSDVTRSAVGTDAARHFYGLLDRALTDAVIATCTPGTTGENVFKTGMSYLEPDRSWMVGAGFCPPSDQPLTEMFGRDVGHMLGKQEPATCVLQPGDVATMEAGMMAAAEIQWPYHEYCVGVEDNFLITHDGPVNLTRSNVDV